MAPASPCCSLIGDNDDIISRKIELPGGKDGRVIVAAILAENIVLLTHDFKEGGRLGMGALWVAQMTS